MMHYVEETLATLYNHEDADYDSMPSLVTQEGSECREGCSQHQKAEEIPPLEENGEALYESDDRP